MTIVVILHILLFNLRATEITGNQDHEVQSGQIALHEPSNQQESGLEALMNNQNIMWNQMNVLMARLRQASDQERQLYSIQLQQMGYMCKSENKVIHSQLDQMQQLLQQANVQIASLRAHLDEKDRINHQLQIHHLAQMQQLVQTHKAEKDTILAELLRTRQMLQEEKSKSISSVTTEQPQVNEFEVEYDDESNQHQSDQSNLVYRRVGEKPDPSNPLWRTRLCKQFAAGKRCPYGDECGFAHGEHQLRKVDQSLDEPPTQTSGDLASQSTQPPAVVTLLRIVPGGSNSGIVQN